MAKADKPEGDEQKSARLSDLVLLKDELGKALRRRRKELINVSSNISYYSDLEQQHITYATEEYKPKPKLPVDLSPEFTEFETWAKLANFRLNLARKALYRTVRKYKGFFTPELLGRVSPLHVPFKMEVTDGAWSIVFQEKINKLLLLVSKLEEDIRENIWLGTSRPSVMYSMRGSLDFTPSDDYRSINFRGTCFQLTPLEAQAVQYIHEQALRGLPAVSHLSVSAKLEVQDKGYSSVKKLFSGKDATIYDALFEEGRKGMLQFKFEVKVQIPS